MIKIEREYKYPRSLGKGAPLELTGLRFGRLVVTGRAPDKIYEKSGKHKSQWYCDCDCGTKGKIILGTALTSGSTQSCGCLHKEVSSITAKTKISHGKKYNRYDLDGKFGIGFTTKGEEFYFDLDDYDKIKNICWYITAKGYVVGRDTQQDDCPDVWQHRLINEPSDWQVVDHINGCKYDNRKENLRNVSQTENTRNRSTSSNNTSGHTGVYLLKSGKWSACITFEDKLYCLGTFNTYKDAVKAREEAEITYFGGFRRKT